MPAIATLSIGLSASMARVAITIVTFNSAQYIRGCLEHALSQNHPDMAVVIVDNASTDDTARILKDFEQRARIVYNSANRGFAGGQNQAIALAPADWFLTLNPDLRLTPNFITELLCAAESDSSIGSVCGKLLAMTPDFEPVRPALFDSTGIYVTPNMRHLDRGSLQTDRGQYDQPEFVFGATGAACLYRREMVNAISFNGEFFDDDFFAYREDADVAWRAQLAGWKCLYVPAAVAYHVRSVLPSNRAQLPAAVNMHSVKNRWLLRIKNMTPSLYRRNFIAISVRDLLVVAGCLLREWSSLRAFVLLAKMWKRAWQKRAHIMQSRRVPDAYIDAWFSYSPVSYAARPYPQREKIAPR
jgi:GT2 family glycosyltransferase